jgi:hypothetical protein
MTLVLFPQARPQGLQVHEAIGRRNAASIGKNSSLIPYNVHNQPAGANDYQPATVR